MDTFVSLTFFNPFPAFYNLNLKIPLKNLGGYIYIRVRHKKPKNLCKQKNQYIQIMFVDQKALIQKFDTSFLIYNNSK